MQRIGVFVCHCGTNIAGTVDVKAVAAALGNEPGVVVAEDYQYMCSQAGQDLIKKAIRENNLNGVVIWLMFTAHARGNLPQNSRLCGSEPVYG